MKGLVRKIQQFLHDMAEEPAVPFGVVSLALLISLAIAPAKDYFAQWKHEQSLYLKLIGKREDAAVLRKKFEPGIHQIWIPELNVVDRCETCHLVMKGGPDLGEEPFREHPPIPHKLTQYGCTMCHAGQGRATTVSQAHYSTAAWEQPLLPARYVQSSCGQCHMGPIEGTLKLNLGRQLLSSLGCVACHRIVQPDGYRIVPTDFPPPLTHIAEKTSREWIFAWIKNPQAYSATATMPNFKFTDEQARAVASFIYAQSTPSGTATTAAVPVLQNAVEDGRTLYGESFCASCHAIQNDAGMLVGGDFGPELSGVGTKVNPQWLTRWLSNPDAYEPATRMPHFRFNAKQVGELSAFLMSKTNPDFLPAALPPAPPDEIAEGKKLVGEYGCAACHEINGVVAQQNAAPDLTAVGSKPLAQIVFTPGMPETLPDYIATKIKDPRIFIPGLKMPKFTLTDQQVDALTTALLAQNDRAAEIPLNDRVAALRPSGYEPAGSAGKLMHDLRCLSCHSINGNGGTMAPDLSYEGSAVQRAWLISFLANPNTLRPTLIRRMPKLNLSPEDISTLADYILQVYQRPELEDAPPGLDSPALIAQGKQLFYSKYECQSCHIVDFNTDKGYIGPQLSQVGARLTPQWIYNWLKEPQALRPGTIEPDQHMSNDDARALTAYLSNLKGGKREAAKR